MVRPLRFNEMRLKIASAGLVMWLFTVFFLFAAASARAASGDMKIEVQLIWATNDKEDPNKAHKPVAPDILEKLKELPLKWANYFEVNKVTLDIPKGESRKGKLSDKCEVEVKNLDGAQVEVALIGKGDPVWKRIQALPKGDVLVLGGNAPNSTAWLVALKRIK
jgi:hypothetical protein